MNRRGVLYDVGRVLGLRWRPVFDPTVVRRELEIIATDLHCTAVRICGRDLDRLHTAAVSALELGLEVWFCPELWDSKPPATLRYLTKAAARAESLRRRWPDRMVLSVGTEATMFTRGIIPGRTFPRRRKNAFVEIRAGRHDPPLAAFLESAARVARNDFGGPITYASLPFEHVDWSLFDIVGIDHYRDDRSAGHYRRILDRLAGHGKPVVVAEVGMRTYRGAESDGNLGLGVTDWPTVALHRVPMIGRLVPPRLKGDHVRDEQLQARRVTEDLTILDEAGVDGAFVCQFVEPLSTYSEDPRRDLDMSSLSLVRALAEGRGTTYPDMTWEPKESFYAVARHYART